MLFAISGSQGCGKSTTLAALEYPTVTRKTSRSILSDWGVSLSQVNNDRELTIKFQEEILARKIADEAEYVDSDAIVFTERTTIDLMVYNNFILAGENKFCKFVDNYVEQCVNALEMYAGVFYITGGMFAPVDDGVRSINQHYQRMVDVVMQDAYTRYVPSKKLNIISVARTEDRVSLIRQIVDEVTKY